MTRALRAEPRGAPPPPPPALGPDATALSVGYLGELSCRRDALEQCVAVADAATYSLDSAADAVDAGEPHDAAGVAHDVARGTEALTRGKRLLDALKAEGEALARAAPGAQRLPALRATHSRLAKLYVQALRAHQGAKERLRAVEANAAVEVALAAAGGGLADADALRRSAARDPAGFAHAQAAAQVERQRRDPTVEGAAAYDEAAARAEELDGLVRSIQQVQALMGDVGLLVELQGEGLDSIEAHAERAGATVARATEQLEAAARKRRCRRSCCVAAACAGLLLTALGVAVLALFVSGAYKALLP